MIDAARILAHDFGERRHAYAERDAILYALGAGLGRDPLDAADLAFLDETRLAVLPSFAVTLGAPGQWIRDPAFGVDFAKLVHAEQAATFHRPLPPAGEIVATARVASLADRGPGRGAVLALERRIADAGDGEPYCTLVQTLLLRGDGGFGGPAPALHARADPDRTPDLTASVALSPRAALIYRLSGDWNPLHIDPAFAARAGFDRPIMHGLGTYATAGAAIARTLGRPAERMRALAVRFAGVVYPGDTLDLTIWRDGNGARFCATVAGRTVLDHGHVAFGE